MRSSMSLAEFAALVDMSPDEIRGLTDKRLLDPAEVGSYDELDLLRLMAVRHYGALGYDPDALATARFTYSPSPAR